MATAAEDPETEARLRAAAQGDGQAVSWLLELHRPRLRRMVDTRLDDRPSARLDASDVVQETLLDAASKLADYIRERPLPFYPWPHRLTFERLARARRHHLGRRALEFPAGTTARCGSSARIESHDADSRISRHTVADVLVR